MDSEFVKLLSQYAQDTRLLDSIRLSILKHIGMQDTKEYIDAFQSLAIQIDHHEGIALAHAMQFWLYSSSNLEYAHEQNKIAKSMFQENKDYEKTDCYLTVLNNDLIYYNIIGDMHNAYYIATEAFKIVKNERKMSYLLAFSTNYFSILTELGLYEEAYQNLVNTDDLSDYFTPAIEVVISRLKACSLVLIGRYVEALIEIENTIKKRNEKAIYSKILFDSIKLMIYVKLDDRVKADKQYRIVMKGIENHERSDRELLNIYHSIANYLVYIDKIEEAKEYYDYIYENINRFLGYKRILLIEIANLYEKTEYKDKTIELKNEAIKQVEKNLNAVALILQDSSRIDSKDFSNLAYHDLYNKADCITEFLKNISSHFDLKELDMELTRTLNKIGIESEHILVCYDEYKNCYVRVDSKTLTNYQNKEEIIIESNMEEIPLILDDKCQGYLYLSIDEMTKFNLNAKIIQKLLHGLSGAISNYYTYRKVLYESGHDQLTGMLNRKGFADSIQSLDDSTNKKYYVLSIDIDNFKIVNDTYGHPACDEVIKGIGNILCSFFQENLVARVGGEEFLAISFMEREELKQSLQLLLEKVASKQFFYDKYVISVTISIGGKAGVGLKNHKHIYHFADDLLYKVKNNKKNDYILEE